MMHPFLANEPQPRWSRLSPEQAETDIEEGLRRAQARIDELAQPVEATRLTFENTMRALEDATEELARGWGLLGHLESVANSPQLRETYNKLLPKVSAFFAGMPLNAGLWKRLEAYSQTAEARSLCGEQRRFLEETLEDFRDSGANLPDDAKERLREIENELSQLTQKFSENVLDSTHAWELLVTDSNRLEGIPESARESARLSALEKGYGTEEAPQWRFTQQAPSVLPVLRFAEDRSLRQEIVEGQHTIGRGEGTDNTGLIWQITHLRQEKAEILGRANFGDLVLRRRMAGSSRRAMDFVSNLHERIRPHFERQWQELVGYREEQCGEPPETMEPWDIAYWGEKLRQARYSFNQEDLRPYLPIDQVLDGLFELVQRVFALRIEKVPSRYLDDPKASLPTGHVEVWHPDVRFYRVYDDQDHLRGGFFADWFPRETKRDGAWMNFLMTGDRRPGVEPGPHIGLIAGNLTPGTGGGQALLSHEEVEVVFHEFGHLLHHLCGESTIRSLNGVNVAWDFVELPSQLMENWCWERESLDLFARHHETGQPIPDELFERMTRARVFQGALAAMRQLAFAKFDLELHVHHPRLRAHDLDAWYQALLAGYLPPTQTPSPTIARRFSHLFASPTGYAAGYYSYKWAEVLDADAFRKFKEAGVLDPKTGKAFRQKILAPGNGADPSELFRSFMGRDPDPEALLERAGLT